MNTTGYGTYAQNSAIRDAQQLDNCRQQLHRRRTLIIRAILSAIPPVIESLGTYLEKQPYHTSILTGRMWLQELLDSRSPHRFRESLGMNPHVFLALVRKLDDITSLKTRRDTDIVEQVAMFLYAIVGNQSNRNTGERFQRSGETISRCVVILSAVFEYN
jgi:hypothetical protein